METIIHTTLAAAIAASGISANGFAIEQRIRWSTDIAAEAAQLGFEPIAGGEADEVFFRSPTHTLRARTDERLLLVGHKYLPVSHVEALVWPTEAVAALNGQDEAIGNAR